MAAKEIWKAVAMADHFEKIQKLPDPVPGCPNFRRVPGYKVTQNNFEILDTKNTFEIHVHDHEPEKYVSRTYSGVCDAARHR